MSVVTHRTCDKPTGRRGSAPIKCGEPVQRPTGFCIGGEYYEVDLCDHKHAPELVALLAPYVEIATKVDAPKSTAVRDTLRGRRGAFTTKDVRNWLVAQGREVPPSGRLPQAAIKEYEDAHRS